jgi:hypothetical protein
MEQVKKKKFVKPELIKFDKPLDEVTLHFNNGSGGCDHDQNGFTFKRRW